jgi:predicted phage-related endonuclease
MPDPTGKTISATQSPALFDASPYYTRWMLYQHFAKGMSLDVEENSRMTWGKKLQPLLIEEAAQHFGFEVIPNADDTYHRRGPLGCTRDATIMCPSRGPGALETKCVFDYRTWMADWKGGAIAPRHYEIQNQQQMIVGDDKPFAWGVICAWVAGDVHYFERAPVAGLADKLTEAAQQFLDDVRNGNEPEPFGDPMELPWFAEAFPLEVGKTIDLRDREDAAKLAQAAADYSYAKQAANAGAKGAEALRAKLLGIARDADQVLLGEGVILRVKPHGKGKRLDVYVPDNPLASAREPVNILPAG